MSALNSAAMAILLCCASATSSLAADAAPVPVPVPAADATWLPRAAPADLPANDIAEALINEDPTVVQARHELEAAREHATMLSAGPQEWVARASGQRRRYGDGTPNANEWSAGVEKTLRINGKSGIDARLGEAEIRLNEAKLGEARHEAARVLLADWLEWTTASRTRALFSEQLDVAKSNLDAAGKRRKAGDASMLEQNSARADQSEVQRRLNAAINDEAKAAAKLHARFPRMQLNAVHLADPAPLELHGSLWRQRILAQSDELLIAQEEVKAAELTAERGRADRIPDPTVGFHVGSDAGNGGGRGPQERIFGVSVSIPLGTTYRGAQAREAAQRLEATRAALDLEQRNLDGEIQENLVEAATSIERWKLAEEATAATRDNAQLTQRAYVLGEADLQAVLLARRQSLDASLDAALSRVEALKARYRLLVDAHLIWNLDHE